MSFHHKIPQYYLRNFGDSKRWIYIYDKISNSIEYKPISTSCGEKNFYGERDIIENNEIVKCIKKISLLSSRTIITNETEKELLLGFMFNITKRTIDLGSIPYVTLQSPYQPHVTPRKKRRAAQKEINKCQKKINSYTGKKQIRYELAQNTQTNKDVIDTLGKIKWTIYDTEDGIYTADYLPVVLDSAPNMKTSKMLIFPVTSKKIIAISEALNIPSMTEINVKIRLGARQYVFSKSPFSN